MIDPYVYPGTNTLRNHFGVLDDERLGRIERLVSVEVMVELMRNPPSDLAFDFGTLAFLHRRLFEDVYPFAGEIREIEMSKPESVLSGRSVGYAHPNDLLDTAQAGLAAIHAVEYATMEQVGWNAFAEGLATLWRAHSFREGNTRAVLLFSDLFLRSRGCEVDFSVLSRDPAGTRDLFAKASAGYGRGLGDLFREARESFIRRSHPEFGYLTPEATARIEEVSNGRALPARVAEPDEAVRGSVLFTDGNLVVLQTSRGLVGLDPVSFDADPEEGARVSVIAAEPLQGSDDPEPDFELTRAIRNAILASPDQIVMPDQVEDPLQFEFDDPDLAVVADRHPLLVGGIASKVLQTASPEAWSEWVDRRYYASSGMNP